MELRKIISPRKSSTGKTQSQGLFLCLFCLSIVIRLLGNGRRDKSCGCKRKELLSEENKKHDYYYHPLYKKWESMIRRCYNNKQRGYKNYGGRGIIVYYEWIKYPNKFIEYCLFLGWELGLQIDRIQNNGNYVPGNIRFVSCAENCQNRRSNKLTNLQIIDIRQKYLPYKYTIKMLAKEYGVRENYIFRIIKREV